MYLAEPAREKLGQTVVKQETFVECGSSVGKETLALAGRDEKNLFGGTKSLGRKRLEEQRPKGQRAIDWGALIRGFPPDWGGAMGSGRRENFW